MDEGGEEIELGQLHAGHVGRVIALGREEFFPYLVGVLVGVRHRYSNDPNSGPAGKLTEVTILWTDGGPGQNMTIEGASTQPVVVRADPPNSGSWDWDDPMADDVR
jgi:hypothetical protein